MRSTSTKKYPVGAEVLCDDPDLGQSVGVVVRHGRDTGGIYTEVRLYGEDETRQYHRARLTPTGGHAYIPCRGDEEVAASERCGECGQSRADHEVTL